MFFGNAVTYVFVIGALLSVTLPPPVGTTARAAGAATADVGFRVARSDRVVGRCLVTIFVFSAFALTFVGQLSVVAEENLGIPADSAGYGLLYATFGVGAALGALSIGTVLAATSAPLVVRRRDARATRSCWPCSRCCATPALAYPVVAVLGFFYFAMVTSLSTALQERLDDSVRGRVMALWIMGFGGTVGLGNLIAGQVIDATSVTAVLLVNAAVAVGLAWYADVRVPADAPPSWPCPPTRARRPPCFELASTSADRASVDTRAADAVPTPAVLRGQRGRQHLEPRDPACLYEHGVAVSGRAARRARRRCRGPPARRSRARRPR